MVCSPLCFSFSPSRLHLFTLFLFSVFADRHRHSVYQPKYERSLLFQKLLLKTASQKRWVFWIKFTPKLSPGDSFCLFFRAKSSPTQKKSINNTIDCNWSYLLIPSMIKHMYGHIYITWTIFDNLLENIKTAINRTFPYLTISFHFLTKWKPLVFILDYFTVKQKVCFHAEWNLNPSTINHWLQISSHWRGLTNLLVWEYALKLYYLWNI